MKVLRIKKSDQEVMRELRLFREFSYRDVASLMGISHSRVQQLEVDSKPLTDEMKSKFLHAIRMSCEDWNLLKSGAENVSDVKLECIQRIYKLNPQELIKCALLLRNLALAIISMGLCH
ncbi:MAG: helix-turn-helix domain-containing protein [Bdellovibrionia bacterium]